MRQRSEKRTGGTTVADQHRALRGKPYKNGGVRRVPFETDERVDGRKAAPDDPRHLHLVRRGDVRADEPERREPAHRLLELIGRYVEGDVRPVESARGECGVLHLRRARVRDGMPEECDELSSRTDARG